MEKNNPLKSKGKRGTVIRGSYRIKSFTILSLVELAEMECALVRQKIFFRQNIEELLSPIISSEYDISLLLDSPGGSAWADK